MGLTNKIELNTIRNEDCFETMRFMQEQGVKVNAVLTSPPYNNSRPTGSMETSSRRYDVYRDDMDNDEYIEWTINLFNNYNKILEENGVILYNINYGTENPDLLWLLLNAIITRTDFMIADMITWKKKTAIPNNVSRNKLTRITEPVFVICRKSEIDTFICNKRIVSRRSNGQVHYENKLAYIEAKNNDGACDLNKATFSTDLVIELLDLYVAEGMSVYDSFSGTGTTANGCKSIGINYLGSEISKAQCEYSKERLDRLWG